MCASCVSLPSESVACTEFVTPLPAFLVLTTLASRRNRSISASGGTGATATAAGAGALGCGVWAGASGTAMVIAAATNNDAPMGNSFGTLDLSGLPARNRAIVRKMRTEGKTDFAGGTFQPG